MFSLNLRLDAGAGRPMYEQLYRAFAEQIRQGQALYGEKLPSKRELIRQLGVSRSTVETAYELLCAEGYVQSRPRSGYFVADLVTQSVRSAPPLAAAGPEQDASAGLEPLPSPLFSTSSVDVSVFPYASWAKLYREVVYNSPELLQRGDGKGEPALRRALARIAAEYRGVRCAPEQIVVGAGIETLLGQLITLFGQATVYAMEDPGYPAIRRLLSSRGRQLRFVPLDRDGMDAAALQSSGADVAYLTPSHQFPMGVTMPASRRSRLLRWAAEAERWIIEDDYDSEFRYVGRPISSMQGMDRAGRVIYLGSFSRSLAPAIRVAYMVLPPALLERYERFFGRQHCTLSRYEQTVMARFLDEGYYARYLRRVTQRYAARREALMRALTQIPGCEILGADGGIHFLLRCARLSEAELLSRALAQGVELRGLGEYCHSADPPPSTLVLGYGGIELARIPAAAEKLRQAWAPDEEKREAGSV